MTEPVVPTPPTRGAGVRTVLAVGLLLITGLFVLEMSGRAPRTAGSNQVSPTIFAATVPGGAVLCQPIPPLPADAARVRLLIGTYGRPVPAVSVQFTGGTVAAGTLNPGLPQGYVTIGLHHFAGTNGATRFCLRVGGRSTVALAGEGVPTGPASEVINGKPQPGIVSLVYLRAGSETWWQLFPALVDRFGLGKADFFGAWTLPAMIVLLVGVFAATIRLLARELG